MRTLSEPWQYIPLLAIALIQTIALISALFGQEWTQNPSRELVFEFAHAVQSPQASTILYSSPPTISSEAYLFGLDWSTNGAVYLAHRIALPVSIAFLFVSFGWWSLIAVENRSIVRRISSGN